MIETASNAFSHAAYTREVLHELCIEGGALALPAKHGGEAITKVCTSRVGVKLAKMAASAIEALRILPQARCGIDRPNFSRA
jgi:hypothetical protein